MIKFKLPYKVCFTISSIYHIDRLYNWTLSNLPFIKYLPFTISSHLPYEFLCTLSNLPFINYLPFNRVTISRHLPYEFLCTILYRYLCLPYEPYFTI